MFGPAKKQIPMWECKECHRQISDEETVGYRLIAGVLYGWCEACFARHRNQGRVIVS